MTTNLTGRNVLIPILKLINYSCSSYPTRASYSRQVDEFRNPMFYHVLSSVKSIKQKKKPKPCITLIKHYGRSRTLQKCGKHSAAPRVFYIFLVFSNAFCVSSQCNTQLRLLYLLIFKLWLWHNHISCIFLVG